MFLSKRFRKKGNVDPLLFIRSCKPQIDAFDYDV